MATKTTPKGYAAATEVAVDKTKGEVITLLKEWGATQRMIGDDDERHVAGVRFTLRARAYLLIVPLPDPTDRAFRSPTNNRYHSAGEYLPAAYDQAVRQRGRQALLYRKAVREAERAGLIYAEEALRAPTLLPQGYTVGQYLLPQVAALQTGSAPPPLLPGLREPPALSPPMHLEEP